MVVPEAVVKSQRSVLEDIVWLNVLFCKFRYSNEEFVVSRNANTILKSALRHGYETESLVQDRMIQKQKGFVFMWFSCPRPMGTIETVWLNDYGTAFE